MINDIESILKIAQRMKEYDERCQCDPSTMEWQDEVIGGRSEPSYPAGYYCTKHDRFRHAHEFAPVYDENGDDRG